ncbi:TIGR03663 family protein [Halobacteriales archaeon QS_8_69_26]|nr:MAG: TIGR03663 family protein [Halobacteriales archaeon QS_8_69_26]
MRDAARNSRTFRAILAVTVVSIAARLLLLGDRTAHWDEGRVAYWVVRYAESGVFEYRAIVHGPFLFHVDKWLFTVFGPSDFVARLPVALVGGLLPLTAWLLRDRLRPAEMVALAVVFAGNPLLLYYSRFMRNDVLVAGFMVFALGLFVRAVDTRRPVYLYAATASFGFAFTAKENAIVYVVCWLGALGLLLDHRLFSGGSALPGLRADGGDRSVLDTPWVPILERYARGLARTARVWWLPVVLAVAEFLVVLVFFFAPRGGGYGGDGVGLWMAFADPTMFPAVVEEALVGGWQELYGTWIGSERDLSVYPRRFWNFLDTMQATAGVVSVFSVVGFAVDRWSSEGPRDVVALAFYWGIVGVVGYPYGTDIWAPWIAVHAVAPLAIPAAVGLGTVYDRGRAALDEGDDVLAVAVAVFLLLVALPAGITAVDVAYLGSDTYERTLSDIRGEPNERNQGVLQWAQPGNGLKETMGDVGRIARANEGVDVLYYGSTNPGSGENHFYVPDDDRCANQPPVHEPVDPCNKPDVLDWHSRLPLPWYMARHDATVDSSHPDADPAEALQDPPPVVVAYAWDREEVRTNLPARYEARQHRFKLYGEDVVVFVDTTALPE